MSGKTWPRSLPLRARIEPTVGSLAVAAFEGTLAIPQVSAEPRTNFSPSCQAEGDDPSEGTDFVGLSRSRFRRKPEGVLKRRPGPASRHGASGTPDPLLGASIGQRRRALVDTLAPPG